MQLDERTVAIVTGAGNGLGQAIACELARRGRAAAERNYCSRRNREGAVSANPEGERPSLKRANLRRKWSTIPKSRACPNKTRQHFTISRHASPRGVVDSVYSLFNGADESRRLDSSDPLRVKVSSSSIRRAS